MPLAISRAVSPSLARCELTHLERTPIDVDLAQAQHHAYEEALARLGVTVVSLPAEPELPDSVFVEDTAVVLGEVAILTRPGAASRRPEVRTIAHALEPYRPLRFIEAPATLDGGDVLRVGKTLFVGRSSRSDAAGVEALAKIVEAYGYTVRGVPLAGCLHLKSAATLITPDTLLINPEWVNADAFGGVPFVAVDPAEPSGANALLIGHTVVYASAHPRTRERIERLGVTIECVDVSELAKAEGAVTCCCLVIE